MIGHREEHLRLQMRELEQQMRTHIVQEVEYLKKDMQTAATTMERQTMDTINIIDLSHNF
jgi:hypothetical protein